MSRGRLRVLLGVIEAGEVEADLDHTAYLRGAADALALVADQGNLAVSIPCSM